MGGETPTPTTEKRAAVTLAAASNAEPTAVNGQHNIYTDGRKTGSIYPSRSVKGGTNSTKISSVTSTPTADKTGSSYPSCSGKAGNNSSKIGCITPTPMADRRAAFTLAVVSTAPTAVKWAAYNLHQRTKNRQHLPKPQCQTRNKQR